MLSPSFYPSIIRKSCSLGWSARPVRPMFHNTYMGPFAPNRTLVERGDFLHAHHSPRGKNVACEEVLLIGLCFRARLSRRPSSGEDNGHSTDDTSRSSRNVKSFNLPHREKNVRRRWRRFYLRALWTCHVGGF